MPLDTAPQGVLEFILRPGNLWVLIILIGGFSVALASTRWREHPTCSNESSPPAPPPLLESDTTREGYEPSLVDSDGKLVTVPTDTEIEMIMGEAMETASRQFPSHHPVEFVWADYCLMLIAKIRDLEKKTPEA
jgi:hypothetical protein